jgi:hypothetical protein
MEVSGQLHDPPAFKPGEKNPRYPLYRRLGGPQSRSGHGGEKKKNPIIAPPGNWTLVVQLVA